jgi:hypothetical protein
MGEAKCNVHTEKANGKFPLPLGKQGCKCKPSTAGQAMENKLIETCFRKPKKAKAPKKTSRLKDQVLKHNGRGTETD